MPKKKNQKIGEFRDSTHPQRRSRGGPAINLRENARAKRASPL